MRVTVRGEPSTEMLVCARAHPAEGSLPWDRRGDRLPDRAGSRRRTHAVRRGAPLRLVTTGSGVGPSARGW